MSLGAAVDLFIAAKAAEGASQRTLEWHRTIMVRAIRRGPDRPVDRISAADLRVWLLELRETLAHVTTHWSALVRWAVDQPAKTNGWNP